MAVYAVTLELPDEVYQRAQHVAQATHRPLEEIVCEWIRPPVQVKLPELERLSDDELLQAARETLPPEHADRLQELLAAQRQRSLSEDEQREALALVEQEDLVTLRKARVLFLLKRGRSVSLFNPRTQNWSRYFIWSRHFMWKAEGLRVEGRTQSGRATQSARRSRSYRIRGYVSGVRASPPPGVLLESVPFANSCAPRLGEV